MENQEKCIICGKSNGGATVTVGEKGLQNIKSICNKKGETGVLEDIKNQLATESKVHVHVDWRKRFTDKRTIPDQKPPPVW